MVDSALGNAAVYTELNMPEEGLPLELNQLQDELSQLAPRKRESASFHSNAMVERPRSSLPYDDGSQDQDSSQGSDLSPVSVATASEEQSPRHQPTGDSHSPPAVCQESASLPHCGRSNWQTQEQGVEIEKNALLDQAACIR